LYSNENHSNTPYAYLLERERKEGFVLKEPYGLVADYISNIENIEGAYL
jgi:hypothetical protein